MEIYFHNLLFFSMETMFFLIIWDGTSWQDVAMETKWTKKQELLFSFLFINAIYII